MKKITMMKRATVTVEAEGIALEFEADLDTERIVTPVLFRVETDKIEVGKNGVALPAELIERAGMLLHDARRWKVGDSRSCCAAHGYFVESKANSYSCPACAEEAAAERRAKDEAEKVAAPIPLRVSDGVSDVN